MIGSCLPCNGNWEDCEYELDRDKDLAAIFRESGAMWKTYELEAKVTDLQEEVASLKPENAKLRKKLEAYESRRSMIDEYNAIEG